MPWAINHTFRAIDIESPVCPPVVNNGSYLLFTLPCVHPLQAEATAVIRAEEEGRKKAIEDAARRGEEARQVRQCGN